MTVVSSERLSTLQQALDSVQAISDEQWIATLSDRKKAEIDFHDRDRDRQLKSQIDQDTYEKFYGNKKYYSATADSKNYVDDWIRTNAKGRVFLDYACGDGFNAIKAAKAGATLAIGIDISRVSVENAAADAAAQGVAANTRFVQADCENTQLPDNSVDVIICSGMLHHLDLSFAFPELRRILAPGGKILCVEALDYNPAIKLYRMMTPAMRTDWEKAHILSLKDVRFGERFFELGEIKYWHVLNILSPHVPALAGLLNRFDRLITKVPLVQLMAWIFTFELIKRKD